MTPHPRTHFAHFRCCWSLAVFVAICLLSPGCTSPAARTSSTDTLTHLEVVNITNFDWQLTLSTAEGTRVNRTRIPAHQTITINVPGATYVIEQLVEQSHEENKLARTLTVPLLAGETYRWQLDTLLSDSAGDVDRMGK